MSTILTLGPVGYKPMGSYNSETSYEKLDVVLYDGVSYVAKQDVQGQIPTNTDYWDALGISGADMSDYYTKSEVDTAVNAKYTKPNDGIPKTDLSSSAQTSLNLADSALQSSDLTDYVTNTDYGTESTGGVVKSGGYGIAISSSGLLMGSTKTYAQYQAQDNNCVVAKGTLENVIIGKDLTTKSYVDGLVGDISSTLDAINGEVV